MTKDDANFDRLLFSGSFEQLVIAYLCSKIWFAFCADQNTEEHTHSMIRAVIGSGWQETLRCATFHDLPQVATCQELALPPPGEKVQQVLGTPWEGAMTRVRCLWMLSCGVVVAAGC